MDGSTARSARASTGSRWFWSLFALALLVFSGVYSYLAPFGIWVNQIFGQPAWYELDPGSFYVTTAHQLRWGEAPLWVGHPGAPLMLLLLGIQKAYYAVASPEGLSFGGFTARHLPTVYWLSKLAITMAHLASFRALFCFARQLAGSSAAALFATLGYATSLPVLYYLSRIAVEPLMMLCFFTAFLATWRYEKLATQRRVGPAFVFAALAAIAAVTGAITKLNFLGPLPFFLGLYLLAAGRWSAAGDAIGSSTRAGACAVFVAVGGALALFSTQLIDWPRFLGFWDNIANAAHPPAHWPLTRLLPAATPSGVFLLSELAFAGLGVAGWVLWLRRHHGRRSRVLWVSAYAGYGLLLFAYRIAVGGGFGPFNYFALSNGVFAVFFGDLTARGLRRLSLPCTGWRGALLGLAWAGLLHAGGIFAVVDSRRHDAEIYARGRPLYDLIAGLGPSDRLGIDAAIAALPTFRDRLFAVHAVPFRDWEVRVPPAELQTAFEALFTPVDPKTLAADARWLNVPKLGTRIVVLQGSEQPRESPDPQPRR